MAIPTMLEIIQRFNACAPAQAWAGNMNVQEGWEDCKEPGWLMLLALTTQHYPHSVGFKKITECICACIEPSIYLAKDEQLLTAWLQAKAFGQNPDEALKDELKISKAYATGWVQTAAEVMRETGRQEGKLKSNMLSEYLIACAINQFLFAMIRHQDVVFSGRLANAAVDSSIGAYVAVTHPDGLNPTFGLPETADQAVVQAAVAARKLEICKILRKIIPVLYLKFD